MLNLFDIVRCYEARDKETFMAEITSEFGGKPLRFENEKYRLIGVPFYNNEDENEFGQSLNAALG